MKIPTLIAANLGLVLAAGLAAQAAEPMVIYSSTPGGKVHLDGTANAIHTVWAVEGPVIAGHLDVGPGFPTEPGQAATPGKVQAQATNIFIRVRSLKSVEPDGRHSSDRMDEVMYEHLKEDKYAVMSFRLTDLELKEAAKSKEDPYLMEAKGDLTVGGLTKAISMPVKVLPLAGSKLQITGSVPLKMSDFKVGPVELTILGVGLKSGDEVKVSFDWRLIHRVRPAAAAAK